MLLPPVSYGFCGVASANCYRCPDQGHQVLRPADVWKPESVYDVNCLDVRLTRGGFILSHIEAPVAARLSPLRRDVPV